MVWTVFTLQFKCAIEITDRPLYLQLHLTSRRPGMVFGRHLNLEKVCRFHTDWNKIGLVLQNINLYLLFFLSSESWVFCPGWCRVWGGGLTGCPSSPVNVDHALITKVGGLGPPGWHSPAGSLLLSEPWSRSWWFHTWKVSSWNRTFPTSVKEEARLQSQLRVCSLMS